MANTREIINRKVSVGNISKITGTMEMVATSRFKKAHNLSVGSKPYSSAISELTATLAADHHYTGHPLMRPNRHSDKHIILVLTGNRGLCGGYNSSVVRLAQKHIKQIIDQKLEVELHVSGKKGINHFKFNNYPIEVCYTSFDNKTTYQDVKELANKFIQLYSDRKIASVQVVYTRFVSTAVFGPEISNLLPLSALDKSKRPLMIRDLRMEDYLFSPGPKDILKKLIPATVRTGLYQCFTDAIVSEQVSRMRSMKAATDNAEQMISDLTREYNRARQGQITGELLDIMGGVEALK